MGAIAHGLARQTARDVLAATRFAAMRLAAIGSRRLLTACLCAMPSVAALGASLPPTGLYQGHYVCAQGETGLALRIAATGATRVTARFYFHAVKANPSVPRGCFAMTGRYDPATRHLTLAPEGWVVRPHGFVQVSLSGTVSADAARIAGLVIGPGCTTFSLQRRNATPVPPAPSPCRMDRGGPTV